MSGLVIGVGGFALLLSLVLLGAAVARYRTSSTLAVDDFKIGVPTISRAETVPSEAFADAVAPAVTAAEDTATRFDSDTLERLARLDSDVLERLARQLFELDLLDSQALIDSYDHHTRTRDQLRRRQEATADISAAWSLLLESPANRINLLMTPEPVEPSNLLEEQNGNH